MHTCIDTYMHTHAHTHTHIHAQSGAGLVYLVLSEGRLAYWRTQDDYIRRLPCVESMPLSQSTAAFVTRRRKSQRLPAHDLAQGVHGDDDVNTCAADAGQKHVRGNALAHQSVGPMRIAPWEVHTHETGEAMRFSSETMLQAQDWCAALASHCSALDDHLDPKFDAVESLLTREIVEVVPNPYTTFTPLHTDKRQEI